MEYIPYNKRDRKMPTISQFYKITIVMYLRNKEHNPPHSHAITQDFFANRNWGNYGGIISR